MASVEVEAKQRARTGEAYLYLSFTMLCWAGNAIAGRYAVGEVSPMVLVSLRWLLVVLLLALFARRQIARDWRALRARWRFVFAMGALGFTAFNALFYQAAHTTTAINIGILQGAIPVFVLAGAFLFQRQRVTGLQVAGMAVTLVGVILVATAGDLTHLFQLHFVPGDLLMVAACALYAGYTIALKRKPAVSFLGFFSGVALAAFLSSLPLLGLEAWAGELLWPTEIGWAVLVYAALFPSFVSQLSFMHGVQLIGAGRAGIFINLVPVFGSIMAVAILNEPFRLYHLAALALVLGGIALAERGKPAS
jgi:drug/metabolite transporter (DMT)-like permease